MSSPFLKIWIRPRKTISFIQQSRYSNKFLLLFLASLYGLYDVIQSYHPLLADMPLLVNFFQTDYLYQKIFYAMFWGVFATLVESGIVFLLSRLLYGEANFRSVFNAVTWSKVPIIVDVLFVWFPFIMMLGPELFTPVVSFEWSTLLRFLPLFLSLILNIWYLFIASQMVTEINKYESGWQGFFVIFSGGFLFIIIIFILVLLLN